MAYTNTMVFGLLIDWMSSHYHQSIWMGVHQACRERGVNLLTLVIGDPGAGRRGQQTKLLVEEFLGSTRFDGFLFQTASLLHGLPEPELVRLVERVAPVPVVSLGATLPGTSAVLIDTRVGFLQLLEHLADTHGHRRFAFAGGPQDNPDGAERRSLLLEFLGTRGLEIRQDRILEGSFSSAWGQEAVARLVPGDRPDFDVLVCADDEIARGALEGLADRSLLVPGDLAVTGFDDILSSDPAALTTARQPLVDLGRTAALLLADLASGQAGPTNLTLETEPVLRQSCGCLSLAALVSQGAPVPETDQPFLHEARVYAEQLQGDLVLEGLRPDHAQALTKAFLEGWDRQDSAVFLLGLKRILGAMEQENTPSGRLHYPLSVFRQWVLRSAEPPARRAFAEATVHQARIVLTEALHAQTVRRETHRQQVGETLSRLNEQLVFARSFPEQAAVLKQIFPVLGLQNFRFTIFTDPTRALASARMVLSGSGQWPDGGTPYDPLNFFPPGDEPAEQPWSFVLEPLFEMDSPLGFFLLEGREDFDLLTVFDQLGERIGRGIETVRRIQGLEDQVARRTSELRAALEALEVHNQKLKDMALRDEMTGLYNRRGFVTLAEHQLLSQARSNRDMALFFGDLDGLKVINDTWGHDAGDDAIRTAAALLSATFRMEDVVARLGGDEFVVLAPGCSETDALGLADRLFRAFAKAAGGRYGISLGWIVIGPNTRRPLAEWMKEADEALYREKQAKKARRSGLS